MTSLSSIESSGGTQRMPFDGNTKDFETDQKGGSLSDRVKSVAKSALSQIAEIKPLDPFQEDLTSISVRVDILKY